MPKALVNYFTPDVTSVAVAAMAVNLPSADTDRFKTQLLIVDMQVDFCHASGTLFVPGATGDLQRLVEFIYHQAEHITNIICSLDSHLPYQIFHPAWWVDRNGNHPLPFTVITYDDVVNKKWQPCLEPQWSIQYTRKLKNLAKKQLTIWPYHCLMGSSGHSLDPELFSAVLWHSLARKSQPTWWAKGCVPETEHYSIIQPEIHVPGNPQGRKNQDYLNLIKASDRIFIAGEAKSHCVLETLEDLIEEFAHQPEFLQRIFVLQDCTSPILHPNIDTESTTQRRFAEFARKGIQLVKSTDPLSW
jgi:nicotinamidase/pyrazinamidase